MPRKQFSRRSTADTKSTDIKEATYTVGISQFAEHGSLDNCREGFLEGLKEAGIEEGVNLDVILDNAQADTGTAATIADNFVSKNVDLICSIATPAAMSAYNSTKGTEIPVIYTAVSDPATLWLAKKWNPGWKYYRYFDTSGRGTVKDDSYHSSGCQENRHSLYNK